jgi:hypothetical protein
MNRNRIKLLITLVLFTVVMAATWTATQADARGLSPGASASLSVAKPGATVASGDPDAGQGYQAPGQLLKRIQRVPGGLTAADWVLWAGRIWATLYLRAAH